MNALQRKLGPLKMWQWLILGGGAGVALYWYKKTHGEAKPAVNPEEEEKLLGALGRSTGGGGEGGGTAGGVAAPGPIGLEGAAGAPGPQGPAPEAFNPAPLEGRLGSIEQELAQNNPASALSHTSAPAAKAANVFTHVNPANGQHYRIANEHGHTVHVYQSGRKVVVGKPKAPTGHQQKPKPARRPKPKPIHTRVAVHHAPPKRAAPKPVHHPHPPAPRRRRRG